jgi:hypothetical protein
MNCVCAEWLLKCTAIIGRGLQLGGIGSKDAGAAACGINSVRCNAGRLLPESGSKPGAHGIKLTQCAVRQACSLGATLNRACATSCLTMLGLACSLWSTWQA